MITFDVPVVGGWGGCGPIGTAEGKGGGGGGQALTRAKRIRVQVLYCGDGRPGYAESIIGETGGSIKLLMSDGSKQVQLNFDREVEVLRKMSWGGGDEEEGRRGKRYTRIAFNSRSVWPKVGMKLCVGFIYESIAKCSSSLDYPDDLFLDIK